MFMITPWFICIGPVCIPTFALAAILKRTSFWAFPTAGLFPFVLLFFRKVWAWITGGELPDETTVRKESAFSAAVLEKTAAKTIGDQASADSEGPGAELRHRSGAGADAGLATNVTVGEVTVIDSEEQWLETLAGCSKAGRIVFVKFTAVWCGPCKKIAPLFKQLAAESSEVFVEVDVDELEEVSGKAEVNAMPTFQAYNGSVLIGTLTGAHEQALKDFIKKHGN